MDLKWFLHKHHTLYDVTTVAGRREGVRAVLTLLLQGPGNIATEAILSLSSVDFLDFSSLSSGDEWIRTRLDNYKRYGEQLVGARSRGGGNLMMMSDDIYMYDNRQCT